MRWVPFSKKAYTSLTESTARLNIWHGSVRSSKTVTSVVRWLDFVLTAPPGNLLMVGRTERTLKRNILDALEDIVGDENYRFRQDQGEIRLFGRKVYLVGANDERSEEKIRGLTLVGVYQDEITTSPESFFVMLLSRLSEPDAKYFGTTNPDTPYHWLKRKFIDRESELDLRTFHFTLEDNRSLAPAYVESLKREYTGLWYDRYILGKWTVAEGAVYAMFNPDVHVVDEIPSEFVRTWVCIDYGTSCPTVFLYLGQTSDGTLWVADEWRYDPDEHQTLSLSDVQLCQHLQEFLRGRDPKFIFVDPSAASFIVQAHHDRIRRLVKADNAVVDGIRNVSSLLATNKLFIHRKCEGLIAEMEGYVWDSRAQLRGEDVPVKEKDHACDALRYGIRGTRAYWRKNVTSN